MWGNAMKATVNLQLLKTTTFDSGALGMLAMVIHQFPDAGHYQATIKHHGRALTEVSFEVAEKSEVLQLNIDLAQTARNAKARSTDCGCAGEKQEARMVSPKGYVLFHASTGEGYSVIVSNSGGKPVFDSTKLGDGDLFTVSVLEPAQYSMANTLGSASGEITVGLTAQAARVIKNLEPQYVEASQKKFEPERVELVSSQGLVFRIKGSARILIKKKSTTPPRRDKPTIRWRKLPTAKQ